VSQERLGPSYFFISLVLGPLNSLVWYVPSVRYTSGLGWRMHCGVEVSESSTNKQNFIIRTTDMSYERRRAEAYVDQLLWWAGKYHWDI
jgi:hypothetical protein